jgi:hypothetical protein
MCYASENASTDRTRVAPGAGVARILLLLCISGFPLALAAQGAEFIHGDSFEDGCSIDSDSDRLPDCAESDSRHFLDAMHAGTSPVNPDTDADGISDGDEVFGTLDGLNLPAMGAHPLRKTLLIEYDWFEDGSDCGAHSHRPTRATIQGTSAAFAASPYVNVDGSLGIDLIQDYGQGGIFTGGNLINDTDGLLSDGLNLDAEFYQHKAANFASARHNYFHYVILAHSYNYANNQSSGLAEMSGDDVIVSLGCFGTLNNTRNTIVHELGHNLGLQHGGNESCNFKPNYNSLMNYRYQFTGIDTNCSLAGDGLTGFSVGTRATLNESNLDENAGICGLAAGVPADWNSNTQLESGVSADINGSDPNQGIACEGSLSPLNDFDDYANLHFAAIQHSPAQGDHSSTRKLIDCQAVPEYAQQQP